MTKRFGSLLRQIRTSKEMVLKELADKMNWTVVYVSDIERGRRNPPSGAHIRKIAEILGVRANKLLNAADEDRGFVELNLNDHGSAKTQAALTLARSWNTLDEEDWDEIISVINKKMQGADNDVE